MKLSENLSNICAALAQVQSEIRNPIKNQENKGVQGKPLYANLEDTLQDYVRPICSKHGISIFQSVKTDENGKVGVCTALFHKTGEYIIGDYVTCDVVIPLSKEGKKVLTEGQATGVCITYLRRYSLNAALGINGDKDTDGSFGELEEEPLTYEKALQYELTFGKYKGDILENVYDDDKNYLEWLLSGEKTEERLKEAIKLVFTEGKTEQPRNTTGIENKIIDAVKVKALISRCESEGVKIETILGLYKVESLEALTEKKYAHINANWEKVKAEQK